MILSVKSTGSVSIILEMVMIIIAFLQKDKGRPRDPSHTSVLLWKVHMSSPRIKVLQCGNPIMHRFLRT